MEQRRLYVPWRVERETLSSFLTSAVLHLGFLALCFAVPQSVPSISAAGEHLQTVARIVSIEPEMERDAETPTVESVICVDAFGRENSDGRADSGARGETSPTSERPESGPVGSRDERSLSQAERNVHARGPSESAGPKRENGDASKDSPASSTVVAGKRIGCTRGRNDSTSTEDTRGLEDLGAGGAVGSSAVDSDAIQALSTLEDDGSFENFGSGFGAVRGGGGGMSESGLGIGETGSGLGDRDEGSYPHGMQLWFRTGMSCSRLKSLIERLEEDGLRGEELRAAVESNASKTERGGTPTVELAAVRVEGTLRKTVARKMVVRHLGGLETCYASAGRDAALPEGRVKLQFVVGTGSSLLSAAPKSSTLDAPAIVSCMSERIRAWKVGSTEPAVGTATFTLRASVGSADR